MSKKELLDADILTALRTVAKYFERRAQGYSDCPVPELILFDIAVQASNSGVFTLACERELRARYLDVGQPLSQQQCAVLMEHISIDKFGVDYDFYDDEINDLEFQIDELYSEIRELKNARDKMIEWRDKIDNLGPPCDSHAELVNLTSELERMGA